jgi:hypothetical protein
VSDVPDAETLSLVMTLPTGVNVRATAQVVRRTRGRMILEARNLPESTQEALRLVT